MLLNLPPDLQAPDFPLGQERIACLDIINHLVVLEPSQRQRPADVLKQGWFSTGLPVLLPHGYPVEPDHGNIALEFKDRPLRDYLTAHTHSVTDSKRIH